MTNAVFNALILALCLQTMHWAFVLPPVAWFLGFLMYTTSIFIALFATYNLIRSFVCLIRRK